MTSGRPIARPMRYPFKEDPSHNASKSLVENRNRNLNTNRNHTTPEHTLFRGSSCGVSGQLRFETMATSTCATLTHRIEGR